MNRQLFANNALSSLPADLSAGATTIGVQLGNGAEFPSPIIGSGDFFLVTLENPANGDVEICKCTSRNSDFLTVVRGQEGFAARAFPAGSTVELRITQATLENLGQKNAGDIPGANDPPTGQRSVRLDNSWVPERPVSPADNLTQAQADAVIHANSPSGGNPVATLADVASGGTGLPTDVTAALLNAHSPAASNPYATLTDLSGLGGGGGTVLSAPVVAALNAAPSPSAGNPYVVAAQLPAANVALPSARLTVAYMRALNDGTYSVPGFPTNHPVLGAVTQVDLQLVFGPGMPFAVGATMVKDGKAATLVILQVDRETDAYVTSDYVWEDDGTAAGTDQINGSNSKTAFKSAAQLAHNAMSYVRAALVQAQVRLDQLQVAPEDVPTPAGAMRLSFLWEPFCQLEGIVSGPNLWDGLTRIVTIAWKTGSADPAVASPKELVTTFGGVYGHLTNGVGGSFITVEQVLAWLSAGTYIQVAHTAGDANIANLAVTPFTPNIGGTSAQALTRTATKGLVSVSSGVAASGALFRDGGASPAGRLAYKDPAHADAIKYPLFEGDISPSGGATDLTSNAPVTTSPLMVSAAHFDAVTDLDLSGLAAAGIMSVTFPDTIPVAAGKCRTGAFWVKGITGTKKVQFSVSGAGTRPAAPVMNRVYSTSTGITSNGVRSDPSGTTPKMSIQNVSVPAGIDTKVLFVFFFQRKVVSGLPGPTNIRGLNISGTTHPFDNSWGSSATEGVGPLICTYLWDDPTDGSLAQTLPIYPDTVDVDVSPGFSNINSVLGYCFIMSSTGLHADVGVMTPQHIASSTGYSFAVNNTVKNAQMVYISVCRVPGTSPNYVPILCGATATAISGITATDFQHSGAAFNGADMGALLAYENAIEGSNSISYTSTLARDFATLAIPLVPTDSSDLVIEGPSEITDLVPRLIPFIYDVNNDKVKICG